VLTTRNVYQNHGPTCNGFLDFFLRSEEKMLSPVSVATIMTRIQATAQARNMEFVRLKQT
jgi:hypothetical protein